MPEPEPEKEKEKEEDEDAFLRELMDAAPLSRAASPVHEPEQAPAPAAAQVQAPAAQAQVQRTCIVCMDEEAGDMRPVIVDCAAGKECRHLICGACRTRQIDTFLRGQDMPVLECVMCRRAGARVVRNHVDASLVRPFFSLSLFYFIATLTKKTAHRESIWWTRRRSRWT